MKIQSLTVALAVTLGLGLGASSLAQTAKPVMTVYKSPTCGCCGKWIAHMKAEGFDVKSVDEIDVTPIKTQYGVPVDAQSCHTALVGGYVLEGHVPASAVKKLLKEKPNLAGLAVPGMPVGSLGMEVPSGQVEAYNVMAFDKAGKQTVYEKH